MNHSKYGFTQLTPFLNRRQFNDYVRKYYVDKHVKHFTNWNQRLTLKFGLLSNRESLRDLFGKTIFKMTKNGAVQVYLIY